MKIAECRGCGWRQPVRYSWRRLSWLCLLCGGGGRHAGGHHAPKALAADPARWGVGWGGR